MQVLISVGSKLYPGLTYVMAGYKAVVTGRALIGTQSAKMDKLKLKGEYGLIFKSGFLGNTKIICSFVL